VPEFGSVSLWLDRLKAGDRSEAVNRLWAGYFGRMVGLARRHLGGRPRGVADEEDVALSAFDSFVRAAAAGRFPRLDDRDDLWQVLFLITARKAADMQEAEGRLKRGGGQVVQSLARGGSAEMSVPSTEPDPAEATMLAEEVERLLDALGDANLRQIAVWKLEGYANHEIAERLGRSEPTVERKLRRIRETWQSQEA
jgi:RNA polymerase sigma factor (sigma-70 family)